jgi:hypothetical protein
MKRALTQLKHTDCALVFGVLTRNGHAKVRFPLPARITDLNIETKRFLSSADCMGRFVSAIDGLLAPLPGDSGGILRLQSKTSKTCTQLHPTSTNLRDNQNVTDSSL